MSDPTAIHDDDADDLRDPVLQRALENAPDQAATPDWRLGESIRAMAHEAVAPSLPELPLQRTWWQRLLGIGAGGGVPWNAAFATVLVGVLVTLMWQREEVPGARPDGAQQQAAPAAAAPQAEVAQGAPAPAPAAPPAPEPAPPPSALDAQLAESRATNAAATRALDEDEARARRDRQAETEAATARARALRKESARPPPPVPPAPPAAPATAEAPSGRAGPQAAITERRTFAAPQEAAPAIAPPRAAAVAPAPAATAPAAAAAPPSFAALSQWTVLHITRPDGETRTLQRAEARELGALIGSAALAGVGARPLRAKVDWRLTLDRNGEALAVLELAGGQVRWREEGVAPGVGSPGAGAMRGLRAALEEASAAAQPPSPPR